MLAVIYHGDIFYNFAYLKIRPRRETKTSRPPEYERHDSGINLKYEKFRSL